jgi:hypothetical protein
MMIYTSSEVQKQFPALLKKVVSEGQVKFKTNDGQIFIIRPEVPPKLSPLEAIRENRARYS